MVVFASEQWAENPIDPLAEAFGASGGSVRIGRSITGGPDGEVRWTAVVANGSVTYLGGVHDDVDVTFTDKAKVATSILQGEFSPNTGFMRGQTKVSGPTSTLLAVLAAGSGDAYEAARKRALDQAGL